MASKGDILTVNVEEIILQADGDLAYLGATVVDVDRTRKEPYYAKQVVGMAKRGHILQDARMERKQQAKQMEEGETRSARAAKFWKDHWHESFPEDGKGKGVYHRHWRGLSEEDTDLPDDVKKGVRGLLNRHIKAAEGKGSALTVAERREMEKLIARVSVALPDEEELLKTDHSVHGDLRCSFHVALWGTSIFLGETKRVRGGRTLEKLPSDDAFQCAMKLHQPKAWLTIARKKAFVSPPGGVGSTSRKWSKFFEIASFEYRMGVWREHFLEIFIINSKLKGRYMWQFAQQDGRRYWQIAKPDKQTPYAESHDKDKVVAELKGKHQRWLVWAKPGQKPELIDVTKWQAPS